MPCLHLASQNRLRLRATPCSQSKLAGAWAKGLSDSTDAAGGTARRLEHPEDLADLALRMLGAERAAQQRHVGRRRRRAGEVDVKALVEKRLPHRRAGLKVGHDDGDDRRLRL